MAKYHKRPDVIVATQWWENGDHPLDGCEIITGMCAEIMSEGKIVRYFRRPDIDGDTICIGCDKKMHVHGWIDQGARGHTVCPGDFIVGSKKGIHYPMKPDEFDEKFEIALKVISLYEEVYKEWQRVRHDKLDIKNEDKLNGTIQGLSETVISQSNKLKEIFDQQGFVKTGSWLGDLEMLDCKITEYKRQLKDRSALSSREAIDQVMEQRDRARGERNELGQLLESSRQAGVKADKVFSRLFEILETMSGITVIEKAQDAMSMIKGYRKLQRKLIEILDEHNLPKTCSWLADLEVLGREFENIKERISTTRRDRQFLIDNDNEIITKLEAIFDNCSHIETDSEEWNTAIYELRRLVRRRKS